MKISDRDKKLILFVLLVAVIALPIFLFIRPKNDKIKEMEAELVSINERYNYLKELSDKQEDYEKEIARLNEERDLMIKDYAGGILKENSIMFLRGIELRDKPVEMWTIKFNDPEETEITEATVNSNGEYVEGLTAVKDEAAISYKGEYDNVKDMLNYIFTYKDKMIISSITMDLEETTNLINGIFVLDQYAITGNGKEVKQANIPNMQRGTKRLYDLILDDEGNPLTWESSLGIKAEPKEDAEEVGDDTQDL